EQSAPAVEEAAPITTPAVAAESKPQPVQQELAVTLEEEPAPAAPKAEPAPAPSRPQPAPAVRPAGGRASNDPRVARRQAAAVAVETIVLQSEPLPAAAAAQPDPDRVRPGRAG